MTRREEWRRAAFDSVSRAARTDDDPTVVLDGLSALSIVEHLASDGIVASPSLYEQVRLDSASSNAWKRSVVQVRGTDADGTFAAGAGLALGGRRATLFVEAHELAGARSQLESIAARHLPLVTFVSARGIGGPGRSHGTAHEAIAAVRDAGWVVLVACNLQEAVDLGLVARRLAETVLVPVVVAVDGQQIAGGLQSVVLPTVERIRTWLGDSEERVVAMSPAQQMLFGDHRRPVPRWLDLERPALIGAEFDGAAALHAAAGQRPFFTAKIADRLEATVADWHEHTGRDCGSVIEYAISDAQVVIVAQGAVVETAIAVAQRLRAQKRKKVGVLGVRWLRPFDGARVASLLRGKRQVWVLDRLDAPLSAEPPLMAEVRSVAQRAIEVGHFGKDLHPGYPRWSVKDQPRFGSVICGLGGGVSAADLSALMEAEPPKMARPVVLGADFGARPSTLPKRQALLDAIRRDHPGITERGIKASGPVERVLAEDALSVAIVSPQDGFTEELAAVLGAASRGSVRGRVRKDVGIVAVLPDAREPLPDPGDAFAADIVFFAGNDRSLPADVSVVAGGAIVLEGSADETSLVEVLPPSVLVRLGRGDLRLFSTEPRDAESDSHRMARWVGAIAQVVSQMSRTELSLRRVSQGMRPVLVDLSESEENGRLEGLQHGFEKVQRLEMEGDVAVPAASERRVPITVRHLRDRAGYDTGGVDSLARFWGETGVMYAQGDTDELTPEPYLSTGVVPALSSTFADRGPQRTEIPRFEPATCTGCGDCWVSCPDSAIGPVALSASGALEGGMAIAKDQGQDVEGLRMVLSKIGKRAAKSMKSAAEAPTDLRAWLAEPFAALADKLPEERSAGARQGFDVVMGAIGDLPVARTAPLYGDRSSGEGEMLALVVNPDSCKGCGACVASCETKALVSMPSTAAVSAEARRTWRLWEMLPDTTGMTVAHAAKHPDVGPLAASMLSKSCLLAMAGGDQMEPGSGARIALRQILAVVEEQQQKRWLSQLEDLGELQRKLRDKLQASLASALPTEDLEALSRGLSAGPEATVGIAELTARLPRDAEKSGVDVESTQRLIAAAKAMGDIADRVAAGPFGLGRARYGVVLAPEAAPGIGAFPFNPLRVPVVIEPATRAAGMARGVAEAQLAAVLGDLAEVRLARLELDSPRAAMLAQSGLRSLTWQQLTPEERRLCPPVILVGTEESFSDRRLADLFETGLPIKIVVLADAGASLAAAALETDVAKLAAPLGAVSAALYGDGVFIAQSSIAHGSHLAGALKGAFAWDGPALIRVLAPHPRRDGIDAAASVQMALEAVRGRVAPLFVFDPEGQGVFGSRFSLAGNPASGDPLVPNASPVHWALLQGRFAAHFSTLDGDVDGSNIEDWLCAEPSARSGTPYVLGPGQERFAVSPALCMAALGWLDAWRTLQEVAGEVTPFTEAVRERVEVQVADAHAEEISAVRADYEQRLASQQSAFEADAVQRLKQRLMVLAGHRPN